MEDMTLLMNIMWTMIGAFLVYFMQAGFAMVEAGFTRAKNAGNIIMKNMMDFVLGSLCFFVIGFALMFGGDGAFVGLAGFFNPYSLADAEGMLNGLPIGVFMIFHTVFCATAATIVSGAMATLATLIFTWVKYGKPDVSMTLNGALAGLVAITAGCDVVTPYEAIVIGLAAGIFVVLVIEFVDKKLRIDDPVGAIGVHGACGLLGTILTGVFGEGCSLVTQIIGVGSVLVYVIVMAFFIFTFIDKTVGLRVSDQEQLDGLDLHEHGMTAYAGFRLDK